MEIPESDYNPSVRAFGLDIVLNTIQCMAKEYPSLTWVSVGCGNAAVESQCALDWRFVDPDPLFRCRSNLKQPYRSMNASSARELIESEPSLVGNCILFLNSPPPSCTFEIEAIQLLKPVAVLTTTELYVDPLGLLRNGGAGSLALYEWRESKQYHRVHEACLIQDARCTMDMRITWYQRDGSDLRPKLPTLHRSLISLPDPCSIQ